MQCTMHHSKWDNAKTGFRVVVRVKGLNARETLARDIPAMILPCTIWWLPTDAIHHLIEVKYLGTEVVLL